MKELCQFCIFTFCSPLLHIDHTLKEVLILFINYFQQRFPTQPDGVVRRRIEVHESQNSSNTQVRDTRDVRDGPTAPKTPTKPIGSSKNVAGPAVYYPPGHTPFAKKDNLPVGGGYQSSVSTFPFRKFYRNPKVF